MPNIGAPELIIILVIALLDPRPGQAARGRRVARQEHPRVPQGLLGRAGIGQGRRRHVAATRPPRRGAPVAAAHRRRPPAAPRTGAPAAARRTSRRSTAGRGLAPANRPTGTRVRLDQVAS